MGGAGAWVTISGTRSVFNFVIRCFCEIGSRGADPSARRLPGQAGKSSLRRWPLQICQTAREHYRPNSCRLVYTNWTRIGHRNPITRLILVIITPRYRPNPVDLGGGKRAIVPRMGHFQGWYWPVPEGKQDCSCPQTGGNREGSLPVVILYARSNRRKRGSGWAKPILPEDGTY
jgi:hypothetical protein